MFKTKRKEHHQIIVTLGQMKTEVKRYKAVQLLMDQVFKVTSLIYLNRIIKDFFPR